MPLTILESVQRGSSGAVAVRQPYLRLLHLELDSAMSTGTSAFGSRFSPQEEEEFAHMARSEGFYDRFALSVAPSIYGTLGENMPASQPLNAQLTMP